MFKPFGFYSDALPYLWKTCMMCVCVCVCQLPDPKALKAQLPIQSVTVLWSLLGPQQFAKSLPQTSSIRDSNRPSFLRTVGVQVYRTHAIPDDPGTYYTGTRAARASAASRRWSHGSHASGCTVAERGRSRTSLSSPETPLTQVVVCL